MGMVGEETKVLELFSGAHFGEIRLFVFAVMDAQSCFCLLALLITKRRQATVTSQGILKSLSMDRNTSTES